MNSWRSTSHLRSRYSMIRTLDDDSVPLTTRAPPEWNRSSAPCPWDSMKDGIRSSSISQISQGEHTVQTTLKLSGNYIGLVNHNCSIEFKYMLIAGSDVFTSQIDYTLRTSSLPNLNCSSQWLARPRTSDRWLRLFSKWFMLEWIS
jgi:hypothetical protein